MKYEALKRHLESRFDVERLRMGFDEIEALLGFGLPPSARAHQAWWSNTRAGHSHAAAWLDAGWKTSELDLSGQGVTFRRDAMQGLAEGAAPFMRDDPADVLTLSALSAAAMQMIDRRVVETGQARSAVIAALLNELALDRRRALMAGLAQAVPVGGADSAAIVREDRDGR